MAIKPASPRITISEIDKTGIVPAVGASGGAFVGNFRWGTSRTAYTCSRRSRSGGSVLLHPTMIIR